MNNTTIAVVVGLAVGLVVAVGAVVAVVCVHSMHDLNVFSRGIMERFSQKVVSFQGDLTFGGLFPKRWSPMPTYGPN